MFQLSSLRGDFFGGVTAAIVALPLAIAFGVSSGAGALAGLYGAIAGGLLAAILGGTRTQITGPTGPMTVIMAVVITHFHQQPATAFTVVMLAGLMQILFGKLGIGRFIKLVPQPVISGFMSGVGVIIIIVQVAPLLGLPDPTGTILQKLVALPALFSQMNSQALILGLLSLAIMLFTPKAIGRIIPPPLIALMAGTLATPWLFSSVPVIGAVPSGLPELQAPSLELTDITFIVRFALVLAILGSIDSLLTSLVADSMTRTHHNSNKELVGQGIGNFFSGLVGGIPVAGATMRTLVNIRAGGHSPLSGCIHAFLLLAVVLGFGSVVSHIPLCVLAGILFKVGIDIIDWPYLKRIHLAPKPGVIIMLTTLGLTVLVDLMTAVAVGFVMASALFVARMADVQIRSARLVAADEEGELSQEEQAIIGGSEGRIIIFEMEGPLSFGSARDITQMLQTDRRQDILLIDMHRVPFIDSSASFALSDVIQDLQQVGNEVMLFGIQDRVLETLKKVGVIDCLHPDCLQPDRLHCLHAANQRLR